MGLRSAHEGSLLASSKGKPMRSHCSLIPQVFPLRFQAYTRPNSGKKTEPRISRIRPCGRANALQLSSRLLSIGVSPSHRRPGDTPIERPAAHGRLGAAGPGEPGLGHSRPFACIRGFNRLFNSWLSQINDLVQLAHPRSCSVLHTPTSNLAGAIDTEIRFIACIDGSRP